MENRVLRKRDIAFLAILALAIYISLDSASTSFIYRLEPAWYFDQRKGGGGGQGSQGGAWTQLPPIITDLDGDGQKEIVFISRDQFLKVLQADRPTEFSEDIYSPEEVNSLRLSPLLNVNKGRTPVALAAGYIEHYDERKSRNQVIVVVREDMTVSCYDSKLSLLWEKAVAHKSHEMATMIEKFQIEEVSVLISPMNIKENSGQDDSSGLVVLGASMKLREGSHVKVEQGIDPLANGDREHPDMDARAMLEHFSIFALDGKSGHVLWKHDGLEIRPEQFTKSLPQHAYRLDIADLTRQVHHAPGLADWTVFRQSLIGELPHDWHSKSDTSLRFAHFVRRHLGASKAAKSIDSMAGVGTGGKANTQTVTTAGPNKKDATGKRGAGKLISGEGKFAGVESPPLALDATLPHDASEHTDHPNVIVAHTKHGLEVIALRTGLPITSLALAEGKSYADLDGDGIVDSLLVLESEDDVAAHGQAFAHDSGQLQHCAVMAISGLPPRAQLFNGSLCLNKRNLQDPLFASHDRLPPVVTATSPLILRTLDHNTMRESKLREVVLAINTGTVTCYSGSGEYHWQTRGAPIWDLDSHAHALMAFDSDAIRVDELGTHDNRHAQILVLGDSVMSILSREGDIETTAEVPKRAIVRPVLGDFDNDFITDIVILTEDALLGYRMEVTRSARGMLIAVLVLAVLALVIFVASIRSETVTDLSRGGKKKIFSMGRSTDDYHVD